MKINWFIEDKNDLRLEKSICETIGELPPKNSLVFLTDYRNVKNENFGKRCKFIVVKSYYIINMTTRPISSFNLTKEDVNERFDEMNEIIEKEGGNITSFDCREGILTIAHQRGEVIVQALD